MAICWLSGALGSLNVTLPTYPKNLEGSSTILGEQRTAPEGGQAVNQVEHWKFATSQSEDASIRTANYGTPSAYGARHPFYYEIVIEALRGDETALTDGREGLWSFDLLTGIYLSARDSGRVALPLEH